MKKPAPVLMMQDRSCFYEEHAILVTLVAAPTDSTFLALAPVKHVDLRTRIC